MLILASSVCGLFKWRQFEPEVILLVVDSSGATLDFLLSVKQDAAAAKRFLAKALGRQNHPVPRVINTDGHSAYPLQSCGLKPKALWTKTVGTGRCRT